MEYELMEVAWLAVSDWIRSRCNRTYRSHNWAGKGSLLSVQSVASEVAHWRPHPEQHTIAEIVLHMAFWKELVATVLSGGIYRYAKSDVWREVQPTEAGWKRAQRSMDAAHRHLMAAMRRVRDRQTDEERKRPSQIHRCGLGSRCRNPRQQPCRPDFRPSATVRDWRTAL